MKITVDNDNYGMTIPLNLCTVFSTKSTLCFNGVELKQ